MCAGHGAIVKSYVIQRKLIWTCRIEKELSVRCVKNMNLPVQNIAADNLNGDELKEREIKNIVSDRPPNEGGPVPCSGT